MLDQRLQQRDRTLRLACLLLILAVGLYTAYAGFIEPQRFQGVSGGLADFAVAYVIFVAAYFVASRRASGDAGWLRVTALGVESLTALLMVFVYPSFIVTCLLVVVAWQIAWSASLRVTLAVAVFQAAALAVMKCTNAASDSFSLVILAVAIGFQAFAIGAAHLARSEARAHDELAKLNKELRAAQALATESARMTERLRIARDLHDIMGHSLTTLTIRLDVAARFATGDALEHVRCAREVAADLLDQVRAVVKRVRVEPFDLRTTLESLVQGAVGLDVELKLPEELQAIDPARADAIFRCAQEVITNTLRHAAATRLLIELEQASDGSIRIATSDDGRGGKIVEGSGLSGMRERFASLGGTLSIGSVPGQGLHIRGAIPAGVV